MPVPRAGFCFPILHDFALAIQFAFDAEDGEFIGHHAHPPPGLVAVPGGAVCQYLGRGFVFRSYMTSPWRFSSPSMPRTGNLLGTTRTRHPGWSRFPEVRYASTSGGVLFSDLT